jgi:hypothetical protein
MGVITCLHARRCPTPCRGFRRVGSVPHTDLTAGNGSCRTLLEGVGTMARRSVAWVAAVVLLAEACVVLLVIAALSTVVHDQHMSLAGLAPSAMAAGAWVAGGAAAAFLLVCCTLLVRTALRDRAPRRAVRWALIVCAVVHGLLGALTLSLVGWPVSLFMTLVLGLLVWLLLAHGPESGRPSEPPVPSGPAAPAGPATV